MSRTTVREALQRLQAAGYVTTRRGRGGGTFIQTGAGPGSDEMIKRTLVPAWGELTELLDYRRLIEQLIARTAAERRSGADVDAIRRAVGLGFDAEPYTPEMRPRALLRQHPTLAEAIIAGDPARAARLAASHFSLTEDMLTELHARLHLRSGGKPMPVAGVNDIELNHQPYSSRMPSSPNSRPPCGTWPSRSTLTSPSSR